MYKRKIYCINAPPRFFSRGGFKWWEKCHQWRWLLWAFMFSKGSSQICSNVSPRWLSLSPFIFLVNSFKGFSGLVGCDGGVSVSWEGCGENVTSRGRSQSVKCLLLFLQVFAWMQKVARRSICLILEPIKVYETVHTNNKTFLGEKATIIDSLLCWNVRRW